MAKQDTGSRAVMAKRRKRDDNEGLTDEERLWKQLDLYGTPPWGSRVGAEFARKLWPDAKVVREPAAGKMSMAGPLAEYFETVLPSDVYPHLPDYPVIDWFDEEAWRDAEPCDLVISNPPFVEAESFVRAALRRARMGVGMLVRMVWIESVGRYDLFEGGENPLTLFCPFSERLPMALGPWDPEVGSATAYAWLWWDLTGQHGPMAPQWVPPGSRDRLWRKDDPAKYGRLTPMPLFPDDDGEVL